MHNMSDCCCYNKEWKPIGTTMGNPSSSNKPHKKYGGNAKQVVPKKQFVYYSYAQSRVIDKADYIELIDATFH